MPEDDEFIEFWNQEGVNASASGNDALRWKAINVNEPIYAFGSLNPDREPMLYLDVSGSQFNFYDGYVKDTTGQLETFQMDCDTPLGVYEFTGYVRASGTDGEAAPVYMTIEVRGEQPEVTAVNIEISSDSGQTWTPIGGMLASGFDMDLNKDDAYDVGLVNDEIITNMSLAEGVYPFSMRISPEDPDNKLAAVTDPAFYLEVENVGSNQTMQLVSDPSTSDIWQISGDYPIGSYLYTGTVTGSNGVDKGLVSDEIYLLFRVAGESPVGDVDGNRILDLRDAIKIINQSNNVSPGSGPFGIRISEDQQSLLWSEVAGSLSSGFFMALASSQACYVRHTDDSDLSMADRTVSMADDGTTEAPFTLQVAPQGNGVGSAAFYLKGVGSQTMLLDDPLTEGFWQISGGNPGSYLYTGTITKDDLSTEKIYMLLDISDAGEVLANDMDGNGVIDIREAITIIQTIAYER